MLMSLLLWEVSNNGSYKLYHGSYQNVFKQLNLFVTCSQFHLKMQFVIFFNVFLDLE